MFRCLASMSPPRLAIFIIAILPPLSCADPSPSSPGLERRGLEGRGVDGRTLEGRARRVESTSRTMDIAKIVGLHNHLRSQQKSSNMGYMKWDPALAKLARRWAGHCKWARGHPGAKRDLPYNSIGQNLYLSSPGSQLVLGAIAAWYKERVNYNYDTEQCSGKCDNYTQIVWAESVNVGCAAAGCDSATGNKGLNGTFIVCYYGPGGNIPRTPFRKGTPCTACRSETGWCTDDICREGCPDHSDCECNLDCWNCGVLNRTSCTCQCPKGYIHYTCSEECKDTSSSCRRWGRSLCSIAYIRETCPAMCGDCEAADGSCTTTSTTTVVSTTSPSQQYQDEVARIGVMMKLWTTIDKFPKLWKYINPVIVNAVNKFCNGNVSRCCPGSSLTVSPKRLVYVTEHGVAVADGYPIATKVHGRDLTLAIVYAIGELNNELCSASRGLRRRRALSPGVALPQEVLLEAIQAALSTLITVMKECCDVTLDGIGLPTVVPLADAAVAETQMSSFPGWGYGTVAVGCILLVLSVLALVTFLCLREPRSVETTSSFHGNSSPDWHDAKSTR